MRLAFNYSSRKRMTDLYNRLNIKKPDVVLSDHTILKVHRGVRLNQGITGHAGNYNLRSVNMFKATLSKYNRLLEYSPENLKKIIWNNMSAEMRRLTHDSCKNKRVCIHFKQLVKNSNCNLMYHM
ncbi:hypothetical protein CHUAL_014155 [Chamberlinius hualienensis]